MALINPKLNLNKTPSIVDNNSLVFAKNIRLDVDNTIHEDYGILPLSLRTDFKTNPVQLTGLTKHTDLIYRIKYDIDYMINQNVYTYASSNCLTSVSNKLSTIISKLTADDYTKSSWNIVGVITNSREFYIFISATRVIGDSEETASTIRDSFIFCFDESANIFYPCNCNWNYSGGTITGCVINNLVGDKILNIGESGTTNLVPLKCINLSKSSIEDDETIYTQAPKVPITNLNVIGNFSFVIPNGVYQFFVRYKIYDNNYTNWFPASKECFAGNKNLIHTNYGTLGYCNTHTDADSSFVFSVEHCNEDYCNYESFQIGFMLSHDDAQYARAWKHFPINQSVIKFDYKASDAEEIEITDLLIPIYQLYNVGNITSFKNKLYISNYTETDFNNSSLANVARNIRINVKTQEAQKGYGDYEVVSQKIGSKQYIGAIKDNGTTINITGTNGIIHRLMANPNSIQNRSFIDSITDIISNNSDGFATCGGDLYNMRIICSGDSKRSAQNAFSSSHTRHNTNGNDSYVTFDNDIITSVRVNSRTISIPANPNDIISHIYNTIRYLNEDACFVDINGNISDTFKISIGRNVTYHYQTKTGGGINNGTNDFIQDGFDDPLGSGNNNRPGTTQGTIIGGGTIEWHTSTLTYYQEIEVKFYAWKNLLNKDIIGTIQKYTTLIPYQQYKFYVHFVSKTGETTNGYYCSLANGKDGIITAPYKESCNTSLYPVFSKIKIPSGYIACFFTMLHCAINSATVYDVKRESNPSAIEAACMELNTRLIPGTTNIVCKQDIEGSLVVNPDLPIVGPNPELINPISLEDEDDTPSIPAYAPSLNPNTGFGTTDTKSYEGTYYHSSDATTIRYFGANGVLVLDNDENIDIEKNLYIINDYESSQEEDAVLIKCTPYIYRPESSNASITVNANGELKFDDYTNLNLRGYICQIYPLDRAQSINFYNDGSSIYKKLSTENVEEQYARFFNVKELGQYSDSNPGYDGFGMPYTNPVYVYSNYNFNYVTISEDPKSTIKTRYNYASTSNVPTDQASENSKIQMWFRLIPSLTMSDIYNLPSMYKDYNFKSYAVYRANEKTKFDNTVRSSYLSGDEEKINIFKFDADDYYNIPTNRGTIVNLISVGDAILVHTEDSMFKFNGSNTLQSSQGEIQPTENQVFNTGVSEIFGSEFGFAGLQYKNDAIVTEQGYIFFDRSCGIIYSYAGQGQIVKLSDAIEKLFRRKPIKNISFGNDFYNNRIFVSILFSDNKPVTLSYSFNDQIKSFVSLHDFAYNYSFSTKTNCYFLTPNNKEVCVINKNYSNIYFGLNIDNDSIYPNATQPFAITNPALPVHHPNKTVLTLDRYDSIVDVIVNNNYEVVKTLDNIEWCGNFVQTEFAIITNDDKSTLKMADVMSYPITQRGPCSRLMIYSDTCITDIFNFTNNVSNNKKITSVDSYKYPRFNNGKWTFNYFRDVQNVDDINNYLQKYDDGREGATYRSDNNGLIVGKYFVVRFFFGGMFKLESLTLNYNNTL